MTAWVWIEREVIVAIHEMQLAEHGGLEGVRDAGLLDSALGRPQNLAAYGTPDIAALAAAYGWGISRNHPFIDGNKRTGWVLARLFLRLNGVTIAFPPEEAVRTIWALAAGDLDEGALADWFRRHRTPA